jgi:hypothetical protein
MAEKSLTKPEAIPATAVAPESLRCRIAWLSYEDTPIERTDDETF